VTARSAYQPQLIGEFTVNHLTRNQLSMSLGISDTTYTSPTTTWSPNRILTAAGGAWAFNGSATAIDGVFCLDFTDLLPTTSATKRYYLSMSDSTAGNLATLKSYKLIDLVHGLELACPGVPQYADASRIYALIDYNFGNATLPPMAIATAVPTSGNIPLNVAFDASASYDPDGTIASYSWDFGDGATAAGASAAHTYVQAGTYTATLAAMDNAGALASCKITILAIDPNVINAPSSLTAGVSGKTVTLRWLDNASNETGYYVERGVKTSKTATVYTRIATLAANASSYSETVASGTYYYRVQAFNSTTGRQSPYSSAVSVRIR
jgi:PKD repeat protein